MGNFSNAVSKALQDAEKRSEILKQEIKSLEFQQQNTFKSPPKDWINHRLEKLNETLNKNTTTSALALKKLLGTIMLEPITESSFSYGISALASTANNDKRMKSRHFYIAHTKIQTLVLLDDRYKGSNWYQWPD